MHLLQAFDVPSIFTSQHYEVDTTLLFLFYTKENLDSEKFGKLCKISQLISGKKVRHFLTMAAEEFSWNPLAWSERRPQGPPGGSKQDRRCHKKNGLQPQQERLCLTMTMKVVQPSSEISRQRQKHLFVQVF